MVFLLCRQLMLPNSIGLLQGMPCKKGLTTAATGFFKVGDPASVGMIPTNVMKPTARAGVERHSQYMFVHAAVPKSMCVALPFQVCGYWMAGNA